MADLELEIRSVLSRYRVLQHWKETTEAGTNRYAVFADGKQIGETGAHGVMQAKRTDLIVADLLKLIEVHHG